MTRNNIWVVEVNFKDGGSWYTTVGVALSRDDARRELRKWKYANPYTFVRLRKYVRA